MLAPIADSARRDIAKIDSIASGLERLMEIAINVATTFSGPPGVVLDEIKFDLGLNPLQRKFKALHQ